MDYIKAISEVGSISVAADNLGISQPALSAHLKKKEQELGVTLFDRSKKPLQLTDSGRAYLEYAEKAVALENEFHQKVADIENLESGKLVIGSANYFNVSYIPKALAAFQKAYPGIEVEIVDDKVPEITKAAWNGLVDVMITPDNSEGERFHYEELADETVYIAVPSDWDVNEVLSGKAVGSSADAEPLTADEFRSLCSYPFVVLKNYQDVGRKMEELFVFYGCRPERVIKAEQTVTTYALTSAGVGVSLLTRNSIEKNLQIGGVQLYNGEKSICRRKIYAAYPKSKYLSKAARTFLDILKEVTAYAG